MALFTFLVPYKCSFVLTLLMGFAGWDEFWGFVRGRVEVSVAALVERLLVLGLLVPPFYLHYRDPVLRCILNLQCVIAGWVVGYLGIRYGLRNPHRKDPLLFHG